MKFSLKKLLSLCFMSILAVGIVSCGSSGGGSSDNTTEKTITGIALTAAGDVFAKGSTVIAVDENGNAAAGTVTDDKGNFKVVLKGTSSSKKGKLVSGNTYLRIKDTSGNQVQAIVPNGKSSVNVNAVTVAAVAILLQSSGIDLSSVFSAADIAITADADGNVVITSAELGKVAEISQDIFESAVTSVVGALFGFDSTGKAAVNISGFLNGNADSDEAVLLKAAADVLTDVAASAVAAVNNPSAGVTTDGSLLNSSSFYTELAEEVATDTGDKKLSDLLKDVVESSELEAELAALATELDAVVTAIEAGSTAADAFATSVTSSVTSISESAPTVTITVSRSGDTLTYSVANDKSGDKTNAAFVISSGTEIKATVSVTLTSAGSGSLSAGDASAVVTSGDVSVTIKNTQAISSGTINLATFLSEAKAALIAAGQTTLADKIPSSSVNYDVQMSGTAIERSGVDNVDTFITSGSTTVASSGGVKL